MNNSNIWRKLKCFCSGFQITTATFHQWENISAHVVPIILALFLGSWSDRRGRKVPLLMGLSGKFIYSCMMVVNATQSKSEFHDVHSFIIIDYLLFREWYSVISLEFFINHFSMAFIYSLNFKVISSMKSYEFPI